MCCFRELIMMIKLVIRREEIREILDIEKVSGFMVFGKGLYIKDDND